jgi:hypothetical protein
MSGSTDLDQVRAAALKRIERAERTYKLGIVCVAIFEALFGLAFLWLMDFGYRLHWLLLLAACLIYGCVLMAIVNLGKYVDSATHTILNAIFAQRQDEDSKPAG